MTMFVDAIKTFHFLSIGFTCCVKDGEAEFKIGIGLVGFSLSFDTEAWLEYC